MLIVLVLILGAMGCSTQDYFVATDKSLQTDFGELKTYQWSSAALNETTDYTLNDISLKQKIREAIAYELDARGYEQVERGADFLVNFRVFENDTKFKGYVDVYKDENYWAPSELKKDMIGLTPEAEIRTRDDIQYYRFNDGTLLIDFVGTDSQARIWTGYASGIEDDYALDNDDDKIKDVIQRIFNEYEFRAGKGAGYAQLR